MRWLDGITDTMDVSLSELLRGTAREGLSLGSCSALYRALGTSLSSLSRPPEEFTTLKAPGHLGLATFHRREISLLIEDRLSICDLHTMVRVL